MRMPSRKPIVRRQPPRVLLALARGNRTRTSIVFVGRDLAFDPADETIS